MSKKKYQKHRLLSVLGLLFGVVLLSACDRKPDLTIPTMMVLPSPTEVVLEPTLIPTWTSTVTPSETPTLTPTSTPTATFTPSNTPPDTATPTITLSPTRQGDAVVTGVNGVNMRQGPGRDFNPPITLLASGTELRVVGRNSSGTWYEVSTYAGLTGWVSANLIEVRPTVGSVAITWVETPTPIGMPNMNFDDIPPQPTANVPNQVVVEAPSQPNYVEPSGEILNANNQYLFSVSQRAREIFQRGQQRGNRSSHFSKVGDSITATQPFLLPFTNGDYDLGSYAHLQQSIDYFGGAFGSSSIAASSAFNAAAVLSSVWADESICLPNESPLACEYRVNKPSIAVIMLGSVDVQIYDVGQYRASMEQVVSLSIERGVVPILTTFPTGSGYYDTEAEMFNNVIRDIANSQQIPLIELRNAAHGLPDRGVGSDKYHLSAGGNRLNFTGEEHQDGLTLRNLLTLQALDLLRRDLLS